MKVVATDDQSHAVKVTLNGDTGAIAAGGSGSTGALTLTDDAGQGDVWLFARKNAHPAPGGGGAGHVGTVGPVGTISQGGAPAPPISLPASIGVHGFVFARNDAGSDTFSADGATGVVTLRGGGGQERVVLDGGRARVSVGGGEAGGVILVLDRAGATRVTIDGETGDIALANGDCAEFFDLAPEARDGTLASGAVMVLDDEGRIRPCREAYDDRVAGVLSGAEGFKPALLLDYRAGERNRRPVALMGKVLCRADARHGAVRAGDLLTTSPTPGHAMRVADKSRAVGAVLGKALGALTEGAGLVPILVMLR